MQRLYFLEGWEKPEHFSNQSGVMSSVTILDIGLLNFRFVTKIVCKM